MDAPALFARLQLRPDADERDVRRAYARELKQIDPETQAGAFQELRETYDQLLWWLQRQKVEKQLEEESRQAEQAEDADAGREPVAGPAPADVQAVAMPEDAPLPGATITAQPASPEVLGREVLEMLIGQLQVQAWINGDDAEDALVRLLDDERLINVDARRYFEWGVAQILSEGWRPGHELLFAPATEVFGWDADRSRLLQFGRAGHIVDAAIEEMALFDTQEWQYREEQKEVIRRTRSPDRLTLKHLFTHLPVAEMVFSHFPNWLHIIANPATVTQWQAWHKETPGWRRKLASVGRSRTVKGPASAPQKKASSVGAGFVLVFFLLMGVNALNSVLKDRSPAPIGSSHQSFNPPRLDGAVPQSDPAKVVSDKLTSTVPLPRGIKADADPAQARIDAAFFAKKRPNAELCLDASDLARMNPETHRRGELGQKFDAFVMDCLVKKLAVMHTDAFEPSYRREQARLKAEIHVLTSRPLQISPPVEPFRRNADMDIPSYKFVPDKPNPFATPEVPRLVTEPSGSGVRYEIK
jgi:hypothetical protein